jgi:hypothetical protein
LLVHVPLLKLMLWKPPLLHHSVGTERHLHARNLFAYICHMILFD